MLRFTYERVGMYEEANALVSQILQLEPDNHDMRFRTILQMSRDRHCSLWAAYTELLRARAHI